MNNAWDAWEKVLTGYGGSTTKIEKLRAELAGKDATIQLLRQLLDAKQQEIDLQAQIIRGLSLKLKVALQLKDLKERHIKELTEKNEPEQLAKGDN